MTVIESNGVTYTERFAWLPTRVTSGRLVWLRYYYMRPNSNGEGVLLDRMEYLYEIW